MLHFSFEKSSRLVSASERKKLLEQPAFGRVFTDHMAVIRYSKEKGWHDAKITPRQPLPIDPASTVLHYGQEIFEGIKAYRAEDGGVTLFRPQANAARLAASARRLAMAELPEDLFVQTLEEFLKVEHHWVPSGEGQSLYLRPFMIASEVFLGVKPATEYLFIVLACPVGAYFSDGSNPVGVPIWVTETYTRAAIGGTGEAKCGGNYAASLLAQEEAKAKGCPQVLFLDAREKRYVEEMGGMNIMFVRQDGTVVTPPLGGTILRGITRDSLLHLGRSLGIEMREEKLDINDIFAQAERGEIIEAFACGTAAVVASVGRLCRPSGEARFGDGTTEGPVTKRLRLALCALQRGQTEDPFGWVHHVPLS